MTSGFKAFLIIEDIEFIAVIFSPIVLPEEA